MKKLAMFGSLALWLAALMITPAPASAGGYAWYPSCASYFACSGYATVSQIMCMVGGEPTYFKGKMTKTIPVSSCSGGCTNTQQLYVEINPGNGRKARSGGCTSCNGSYIFWLDACANCS